MRDLVVLFIHLLATLARLPGPGGARSIVADSLLLKQQRQSLAHFPLGTIPTTAIQPSLHTRRDWNLQRSGGEFFSLALPTLRRGHDRGSEIYRCGIIHMRLLRFFVACPPLAARGCSGTPTQACAYPTATGFRPGFRAHSCRHVRRYQRSRPRLSHPPLLSHFSTRQPTGIQIP
jgi:hypothetical protein